MKSLCFPLVWVLTLAGCLRPDHDLEGKRCDTDHPCPDPYFCTLQGLCTRAPAADAGLPNLLGNGDFEDGLKDWAPSTSGAESLLEVTPRGRTGQGLRVYLAPNAGGSFSGFFLDRTVLTNVPPNQRYCAEIYVARDTARNPFTLTLRRFQTLDLWQDERGDSLAPPTDDWTRLTGEITAVPPYTAIINMRVATSIPPVVEFRVDDARLWEAPPEGCP